MFMKTFGIEFPFKDSEVGDFVRMTENREKEIRSNLIHLLLTKKGSRYFLPDFGTRIYEYIFEQNDFLTFNKLQEEIYDSIKKYIPNITIKSLVITKAEDDFEDLKPIEENKRNIYFKQSDTIPYTATIKINYNYNDGAFTNSDFIIINI